MSITLNIHRGPCQTVRLRPGVKGSTHWITLLIDDDTHQPQDDVTIFVEAEDFPRYERACAAFNDALKVVADEPEPPPRGASDFIGISGTGARIGGEP